MARVMEGNWTHFGDKGGRWHYTPAYNPPARQPGRVLAPPRGHGQPAKPSAYNKYTLPGPGPKAGGRYSIYAPSWQNPKPSPGVPTPFSSNWKGAGSYNARHLAAQAWRLGRLARKISPVGRALDIGFQLLDTWAQTSPGGLHVPDGWAEICRSGNGPFEAYTLAPDRINNVCGTYNIGCDTVGTLISGDVGPGMSLSGDTSSWPCTGLSSRYINRAYGLGPKRLGGTRMDVHLVYGACVDRRCGEPRLDPDPIEWRSPLYSPMPNLQVPVPVPSPGPRVRVRPRAAPRPGVVSRPGVRSKPAPYYPHPPSTPVPTLPKRGETKKVLRDPWIADFYGRLTELKDALKCIEKNTKGYRPKGGLFNRMSNLAGHIYARPHSVDWVGVGKCLVANHVEDAVIGKVNQLANQITRSPYWVRPVGVGRGGFSMRMN